jgi:hypothetical protein
VVIIIAVVLVLLCLLIFAAGCSLNSEETPAQLPEATNIEIVEIVDPTETPPPTKTNTPKLANTPEPSPVPIVYYYFVELEGKSPPAGSVVILPDILILGPALSDIARSPDTATNIGSALQTMITDPRNEWTSTDVNITSITFREGAAYGVLEGEYFGAGDIVLIAARAQILMTVFAEASVQTATITLNGKNIANLGISHGSQVKPADFTYTRADIETFMAENAYWKPLAEQESQENSRTFSLQGIWQQNGFMAAGWTDRYHFYPSGTFHYYPNEMICSKEKIEKIGTWKYENTILTLTTTKQVIKSLEIYLSGQCSVIGKKEVKLTKPSIEQFTIVDHGTQEGDIYHSISINDLQFWKFSEDASSYGDEKFPE